MAISIENATRVGGRWGLYRINEYPEGVLGIRVPELTTFLRSISAISLILRTLIEILMMDPHEVEKLRQELRAECIRQKQEYEFLASHR